MDYSEDEKKAMGMVENYFKMIEGIGSPKLDIPSQNRGEMLDFLKGREENSQLIYYLSSWVKNYDKIRREFYELSNKKFHLEQNLYTFLGRPSFG